MQEEVSDKTVLYLFLCIGMILLVVMTQINKLTALEIARGKQPRWIFQVCDECKRKEKEGNKP